MVRRVIDYWNESTTFGKIVLAMCVVPALILGIFDYVWVNLMDMCDKLEKWRYKTFWLLKRDKELYDKYRNPDKN